METRNNDLLPAPPGVIPALIRGFNTVANRPIILLIPILFDLFLWLGPRFSVYKLMLPTLDEMQAMTGQGQVLIENMDLFYTFFEGFNAFVALRTFPLGIFSLMSANISLSSPLGERMALESGGIGGLFLWLMLLTIAGWLLGGLYFYSVARITALKEHTPAPLGRSILQGFLLSGIWTAAWMVLSLPILVFTGILLLISPAIVTLAYLLIVISVLWLAVPVFFSSHGIFLHADHLFRSTAKSFRIMRYALPSMGWFVVTAMVLSQGMNFLWRIAPADSWMTLFGIFGHAFISTALLAASFIYYHDLNDWVENALEWMKTRTKSVQA